MYTKNEKETALRLFHKSGSVTETVRILGYPTLRTLYTWISQEGSERPQRKPLKLVNTVSHPRNPTFEVKMDAIHRCFELGESVKSVAEEIGYTRASIYTWRKKFMKEGAAALMNEKNVPPGSLEEGNVQNEDLTVKELQKQIEEMRLEIDVLKETINVLKKDPGVNVEALKNKEKTVIVDAMKDRYPLSSLLKILHLSRSSYYYQKAAARKKDKYAGIRKRITEIFQRNNRCYGYRRIYGMLRREGVILSEKVVRRIMKEEHLIVRAKKQKRYSSYKGEITPSVPNVIQRNFHADHPNEKWLTDITEFAIPAGKIYLSTIVDCFDGLLPAWTISAVPDSNLVNTMLDKAISTLKTGERPLIHSDRGCHYRWPGWIDRMERHHFVRSMSKKGCSPDNSACEGVFGRLKNEMFYGKDWRGVSIQRFIEILNEYLIWYNEKRIKVSLQNMSPVEYRHSLGIAI